MSYFGLDVDCVQRMILFTSNAFHELAAATFKTEVKELLLTWKLLSFLVFFPHPCDCWFVLYIPAPLVSWSGRPDPTSPCKVGSSRPDYWPTSYVQAANDSAYTLHNS